MAFYISKKRKCFLCKCLNVKVKSIFVGFRLGEMKFYEEVNPNDIDTDIVNLCSQQN